MVSWLSISFSQQHDGVCFLGTSGPDYTSYIQIDKKIIRVENVVEEREQLKRETERKNLEERNRKRKKGTNRRKRRRKNRKKNCKEEREKERA